MTVKTCLLVSDDPDDHQAFSEAIAEVSSRTVVLISLDSDKALLLLRTKKYLPDYLFLDLSMQGIRINSFLKTVKGDPELAAIPTVVYGDEGGFGKIEPTEAVTFFSKEFEYSDLRQFLRDFIKPTNGH